VTASPHDLPTGAARGITDQQTSHRWTICAEPRPAAAHRLYCFPQAGGSPADFTRLSRSASPDLEVQVVVLPGRANRIRESPYHDLSALIDALARDLCPKTPYAIFGHSLGALIAHEYTRAVIARGLPQPSHLFVSGQVSPADYRPLPPTSHLDDAAFLRWFTKTFGVASGPVEDPELLALVVPYLRADIALQRSYRPVLGQPLDVPIIAFAAVDDGITTEIRSWERETTGAFTWMEWAGDHGYLLSRGHEVLQEIEAHLRFPPDPTTLTHSDVFC
jgi:medium-chain acyl-[acyl-carrier-protein] hydrolase